ncbi:ATP-binding protein [Robertmurraya massiliosenegalensis]|uniref:sensor histidine kinase n=1 Tax=Robertmurraya TaxID=2837507 RepID=UPI0039A5EF81
MMESVPKKDINRYLLQSSEDEIKRIALDLHEGVGQTLYSVYTGIQFLESSTEDAKMKNYIREMAEVLERTIQEVRYLSVELHPPTLSTIGLFPALQSYLKLYTSTFGIVVEAEQKGEELPLPVSHRIGLFRVCQEALANIAKYADSDKIKIQLIWEHHRIQIMIEDFGIGFDVKAHLHSHGLAAMGERMKLIGGECIISSELGKGTMIRLDLGVPSDVRREEERA